VKSYLISAAIALASGFVGTFMPAAFNVGVFHGPTNVPLAVLYGFGWFVAGFISNFRSPNVQIFGALIWPLLVMAAITYFLGKQLSRHPDRMWVIVIGCVVVLCLIIPGDLVAGKPSKYIPMYYSFVASVY
jgi:hypothetical protein